MRNSYRSGLTASWKEGKEQDNIILGPGSKSKIESQRL